MLDFHFGFQISLMWWLLHLNRRLLCCRLFTFYFEMHLLRMLAGILVIYFLHYQLIHKVNEDCSRLVFKVFKRKNVLLAAFVNDSRNDLFSSCRVPDLLNSPLLILDAAFHFLRYHLRFYFLLNVFFEGLRLGWHWFLICEFALPNFNHNWFALGCFIGSLSSFLSNVAGWRFWQFLLLLVLRFRLFLLD